MSFEVVIGGRYRNLKTCSIYEVIGIAICSETREHRVLYVLDREMGTGTLWDRPLVLFLEKFEPVDR